MALDYITGSKTAVTAAKLNQLWAEVDTIAGKALDEKSCLLVSDHTDRTLFGQPFYFFTASDHTTSDYTVFRGAIGAGSGKTVTVSNHDQASYDTAAAGATITSTNTTNYWAKTSDTLNLEKSLKAHTRTVGSDTLYLWEDRLPHPEKVFRYAVAELVIGDHSGTFTVDDSWNKFQFFRIHNLTSADVTVNFGSTPHHTFTVGKFSQKCVRRDSVTSGYDSTYRYVWKVKAGDPRFIKFTSYAGSLTQTMEANNVTNPSWLYRFFSELSEKGFIYLDRHTWTDIGSDYQDAGKLPTISNSTLVGDLIYTKGTFSKVRKITSGSTFSSNTYTHAGFSTLPSLLTALGYSTSLDDHDLVIDQDTGSYLNNLAGITTNLFDYRDNFRVVDPVHGDKALLTGMLLPPIGTVAASKPNNSALRISAFEVPGDLPIVSNDYGDKYSSHTTTLGTLVTALTSSMPIQNNQQANTPTITCISTTEGPILTWTEKWYLGTAIPETMHGYTVLNMNWRSQLQQAIDSNGRLEYQRFWRLNTHRNSNATEFYFAGWPTPLKVSGSTMVNRYDRIFEGGRKVRRYGTKDSDGTHNDITADPVGISGADFGQDNIETLTDSTIATQTSSFALVNPTFSSGNTDKANIPVVVPDGAKQYQDNKTDQTWLNSNLANLRSPGAEYDWTTIAGDEYIRLNLLREHYNDLVTQCKKVKRIRTLAIDSVYFGEKALAPNENDSMIMAGGGVSAAMAILPKTAYAVFTDAARIAAWTAAGATISDSSDLPNTVTQFARVNEKTTPPAFSHAAYQSTTVENQFAALRWVKITDAMSAAAALGFKFRFTAWLRSLAYNPSTAADTYDTMTMSTSGDYVGHGDERMETGASPSEGPFPPPCITGGSLLQTSDNCFYGKAANNSGQQGGGIDVEHYINYTSNLIEEDVGGGLFTYPYIISEKAITLHLYDTSVSGTIGTLSKQLVQSGSTPASGFVNNGAATTSTYTQGTHNLSASSATQQHRYALELAHTTHSA